MEDELNLDELDQIETSADNKLKVKNRFQQLANDKRTLSQEKELEVKARTDAEAKATLAEKNLEFYKTFSSLSAKHPEATNYQEQILERVNKGYDPEEATLAVLAKEGKLGNQTQFQPAPRTPTAEGGSAITNVSIENKSVDELSMDEKLTQLREMEKTGELVQALRQGINRS